MIEKVKSKFEKVARKGNLATLGAVGALMLAGCGETSSQPAEQPAPVENPMTKSLNDYRDRVNFGKKARVVLNSCVAWSNQADAITVTQNPGIDTVRYDGQTYSYFVWSYADDDKKFPRIQQMDGAQAKVTENGAVYGGGPYGAILQIDLEKQKGYLAHATNRALDEKPTFADNGQIYHTDAETGVPVMNTVITEGPLTENRVNEVCTELDEGKFVEHLNPLK
ncbi:MAG TPA: hypothetical protein VFK11_00570 [Candidatus Saccharimonadales bacterium]|nr:hypothetical protein [Candidatus Saccharimonadales bacterium]